MVKTVDEIVKSYIEDTVSDSTTLKEMGLDESAVFDIKVDIEDHSGFQIPDHEVENIDFEMTFKQFIEYMKAVAERYTRKL